MKERPIQFSAEMVRAILNGSKTQTRRIALTRRAARLSWPLPKNCPYGVARDRLWLCEEPTIIRRSEARLRLVVTAVRDERLQSITRDDALAEGVERHDDDGVTYYGPLNRGHACPIVAFASLWNSIHGKRSACTWADNPRVWVISFRRVMP